MDLIFLFKKAIARAYQSAQRVSNAMHYWSIATNANIRLGINCRIEASAKIETKYGGTINIGNDTEILEGVLLMTYGGKIAIGERCSINPYTVIYGHGDTTIGNNVLIAGGCMIIPSNHTFGEMNVPISHQPAVSKGIVIENNVWIGHGCSILDNVVVGEGAVIAAGSVVNRSIPPFSVAAGVPARVIKKRA